MGTLAIGFGLAWACVAAYVGWLSWQQRRLSQRLDAMEPPAASAKRATRARAA